MHFIVSAAHLPPARSQSARLVNSEVDGLAAGGLLPRSDGIEGEGAGLVLPGALGLGVPESVPPAPGVVLVPPRVPLPDGA